MEKTGVIYSAHCVQCRTQEHRVGRPISDGEKIKHVALRTDHNGLTESVPCNGAFVSVMGRTREEVSDAADRFRAH